MTQLFSFLDSATILADLGFSAKILFLFLESIKNIYFSSRNLDLLLSSVELSGTLFRKKWGKNENPILEVWDQPQFPLAVFMPENPRNERFRSVSDQEKNPGTFFLPDGGEILDGSGRSDCDHHNILKFVSVDCARPDPSRARVHGKTAITGSCNSNDGRGDSEPPVFRHEAVPALVHCLIL